MILSAFESIATILNIIIAGTRKIPFRLGQQPLRIQPCFSVTSLSVFMQRIFIPVASFNTAEFYGCKALTRDTL